MSYLLNSGHVGLGYGKQTDEEIIGKWEELGFLYNIEQPFMKRRLALSYEHIAHMILTMEEFYSYDRRLDTVIFPITRRVITKIFELGKENGEGMVFLLKDEQILKRASAIFSDAVSIYNKHFSKSDIDIEAEATAWVSDMIAQEYVGSFRNKKIIKIEEAKFDVILKVD